MSDLVGLALRENRIDGVVVRRRWGRVQLRHAFSVSSDEGVAAILRAKLRELRVRTRRIHVGIPRRRAVVKVLELPRVAGMDLRRAVGFELERHLPFPAADAIFDFHVLDDTPGQPARVLLVAAERRVFDQIDLLLRDAGVTPQLVDVAIHSVATLAAGSPGSQPQEGRVVIHIEETEAELAVVREGRPILSRAFPLPVDEKARAQALGDELRRSLASLPPAEREVGDVIVTGAAEPPGTEWTGLPVHGDLWWAPGAGDGTRGAASAPALAMALRRPSRGRLRTSLMPDALRPRPFPWAIAVTATLAAATILMALAIPALTAIRDERRLATLTRRIEELAPEVREVKELGRAVQAARREAQILRAFEAQHLRPLPVLRELTERLPGDVWLTQLSIDAKGVNLAGFAAVASQLIPLLEASPMLESVQFTSPVTKGRDREQFRLKAGWGGRPAGPPAPTPEGGAAAGRRGTRPGRL